MWGARGMTKVVSLVGQRDVIRCDSSAEHGAFGVSLGVRHGYSVGLIDLEDEGAGIGSAILRDGVDLVECEVPGEASVGGELPADVVELDGARSDLSPGAEADISA